MARLLEQHGMDLLDQYEVPVPDRHVASTPSEVRSHAVDLDSDVVIKALVPVGKRLKGGGIDFASSPAEAETVAGTILGTEVHGYPAEEVLVAERVPIDRELFLSFTLDTEAEHPVAVLSSEGGIDVESAGTAETVVEIPLDPDGTLHEYESREGWRSLGLERSELVAVSAATTRLGNLFLEKDLDTLEINPLVVTPDDDAIAVAVVAKPDGATDFRHPSLIENTYPGSDHLWRPPNERELRMHRVNENNGGGDVTYMEFDGNAGLVMYSGGMSLQTIDTLIQHDVAPANYSDINPPPSYEKTYELTEILLERDDVDALLGTGNIANLSRVDVRVEAVLDAVRDSGVDTDEFPVVIRMAGEGQERARELAAEVPGVDYFADDRTVTDAISVFVERVRKLGLQRESVTRGDIV